MAREKLIRGEEFEDEQKFKKFIQDASRQIRKLNFEKRNERDKRASEKQVYRFKRREQESPEEPFEETLNFEEVVTLRSSGERINYLSIQQMQTSPVCYKSGTRANREER